MLPPQRRGKSSLPASSEERFRLLADNSRDLICLHEPDGRYLYVSPSCQALLGYDPEELLGEDPYALFHPDDRRRIREEAHQLALAGDSTTAVTYRIRKKSGRYVWFETLTQPIFDAGNRVVRLETCSRDVSERVAVERALRESEERYRSLVELSQDAILVRTGDEIVFANPACATMLGASDPGDLIGRSALEIVHPDFHQLVSERMRRTDQRGERFGLSEQKFQRLDGAAIDVEVCSGPIVYGNRKSSHVIFRDITQRKQVADALRASEERFRIAARAATDLIYEWDVRRDRAEWFGGPGAWLGYATHEIPRTTEAFLGKIHPEDRDRTAEAVARTVADGKPFAEEYRIRAKNDSYHCWRVRAVPVFGDDGKLAKYIGACSDITEQKKAEAALRESEAALRGSQADLRALTADLIASQEEARREISRELHDDLNQQLPMLALDAETLAQDLPEKPAEIRRRLQSLRAGMLALSDNVRRIAYRLHPSILEHLGLAVALRSLCSEFSQREGIRVTFRRRHVPAQIPPEVALCLYRIAQECLRNIAKHSGSATAQVTLSGAGDESLRLTISDAGVGFAPLPAKHRKGLGIVSMEERVRLLDGTLSIESRPEGGTRVRVRISRETKAADRRQ